MLTFSVVNLLYKKEILDMIKTYDEVLQHDFGTEKQCYVSELRKMSREKLYPVMFELMFQLDEHLAEYYEASMY